MASSDVGNRSDGTARASDSRETGWPGRRRRITFAWCLVAVWAGVIWMLGGDDFSLAKTSRGIEPWLESGDPNRTAIRLAMLDFAAGSERDLVDQLRTTQAEMEEDVRLGEAAREAS